MVSIALKLLVSSTVRMNNPRTVAMHMLLMCLTCLKFLFEFLSILSSPYMIGPFPPNVPRPGRNDNIRMGQDEENHARAIPKFVMY